MAVQNFNFALKFFFSKRGLSPEFRTFGRKFSDGKNIFWQFFETAQNLAWAHTSCFFHPFPLARRDWWRSLLDVVVTGSTVRSWYSWALAPGSRVFCLSPIWTPKGLSVRAYTTPDSVVSYFKTRSDRTDCTVVCSQPKIGKTAQVRAGCGSVL